MPPEQGKRIYQQARRLGLIPETGSDAFSAQQVEESLLRQTDEIEGGAEALRTQVYSVEGFACPACNLLYKTEDDIPNFLIDEAEPWKSL